MPLHLKTIEATATGLSAKYSLTHSTPGREGTVLEQSLTLRITADRCWCEVEVTGCDGPTTDVALDKMAAWLRRLADGLQTRGASLSLPV